MNNAFINGYLEGYMAKKAEDKPKVSEVTEQSGKPVGLFVPDSLKLPDLKNSPVAFADRKAKLERDAIEKSPALAKPADTSKAGSGLPFAKLIGK